MRTAVGIACLPFTQGTFKAEVERSMHLLRAIDATIDNIQSNVQIIGVITGEFSSLASRLRECAPPAHGEVLDPDGAVRGSFEQLATNLRSRYEQAVVKRELVRNDGQVKQDDGLEEAYTRYIEALADSHNAVEEARDALDLLCALQSPTAAKTFSNVDDLLSDLLSDAAH